MQRINADRLVRDLDAVAADVEELVKSTAGNADEAIVEARKRIESSLGAAKENLQMHGSAQSRTRRMLRSPRMLICVRMFGRRSASQGVSD